MKFFSKVNLSLCLGIIALSASLQSSVATPIGPPIRISPVPGVNPDPILQNLPAVMDNFYQPPYYPGGVPDYLSQIYYMSDIYIVAGLRFNPCNDKITLLNFGQNFIIDDTNTFNDSIGSNTSARSSNRGLSFIYGPPVEQIIPLGGDISQLINASLGPDLALEYTKDGRLIASGQGFDDFRPNTPSQLVTQTGFLISTSDDNGATWKNPKIMGASDVNWWMPDAVGWTWWDYYVTADPSNPDLWHIGVGDAQFPFQYWGNLFYQRTEDFGKTFTPLKKIYSMVDDPVWQKENFSQAYVDDPSFDPTYLYTGGFTNHGAHPLIYDENVVLQPCERIYPYKDSPIYTTFPPDTATDQAMIRSEDGGKTWEKVAGATPKYIFQYFPFDPGYINPFDGTFFDSSGQGSHPVISPFTGRIYICYEAGNPAADPDEFIAQTYLYILLNASSDKGKTFSKSVQINRTPTDISFRRQQAFAPNMVMTKDGYLVVFYYDLRNWMGFPGEDIQTTPLPVDGWLAIYREVDDPNGGSTGVGLDFVEEIRVTEESFNARYGTQSPYHGATCSREGATMGVNEENILYVVYSRTNEPSDANIFTNVYKGMTVDTNSRFTVYLQRYKFALPSNQ